MARFTLTGITPLLMHSDDIEATTMVSAWRKSPANKSIGVPGDDRSPPWTWQTYCYRDESGNITLPSANVMACLKQAGAKMILKRQTTFKAATQSGLLITDENLPFTNGGKTINVAEFVENRDESYVQQVARAEAAGFELYMKRVPVNTTKHIRCRPKFKSWSVTGTIKMMAPEITLETLTMLFELAGAVGLCDWRPSSRSPGIHGMFEASVKKA